MTNAAINKKMEGADIVAQLKMENAKCTMEIRNLKEVLNDCNEQMGNVEKRNEDILEELEYLKNSLLRV